jgi:hypothetical protein
MNGKSVFALFSMVVLGVATASVHGQTGGSLPKGGAPAGAAQRNPGDTGRVPGGPGGGRLGGGRPGMFVPPGPLAPVPPQVAIHTETYGSRTLASGRRSVVECSPARLTERPLDRAESGPVSRAGTDTLMSQRLLADWWGAFRRPGVAELVAQKGLERLSRRAACDAPVLPFPRQRARQNRR